MDYQKYQEEGRGTILPYQAQDGSRIERFYDERKSVKIMKILETQDT